MQYLVTIFLIAVYLYSDPFNDYEIFHWVTINRSLNYFLVIVTLDYFQIITIMITLQWTSSWT